MKIIIPPGYRSQSEDCPPDIDWLQFQKIKNYTPTQRLEIAIALIRNARRFSLKCLQQNFPKLQNKELACTVAQTWLQEYCPSNYVPQTSPMSWIQDSITLAATIHKILTQLNLPYYVTGGVAAIAYGEPRTTLDLDVVVYVDRDNFSRLITQLENDDFYVAGINDVVIGQMSVLQITQMATISRSDIILTTDDVYEQLKLSRRQIYSLPDGTEIYVASAEDIILSKLVWGQSSKSDKQWRDVLGILKTQRERLDFDYLNDWSQQLSVDNELTRAKRESGL
jgi:hypothetical protein